MKIYAQYIKENNIQYRKTTLLQFGDSWDLIGSAVLKNPGGANPIEQVNNEISNKISNFLEESINKQDWYHFSGDPTIVTWLPRIFNGHYLNKTSELNGVIQLFNLFYIKNPNINEAIKLIGNSNNDFLCDTSKSIIEKFRNKPVYLGWFDKSNLNIQTQTLSKELFDYVAGSQYMYLNEDFSSNKFYHPEYIGRFGGHKRCKETLEKFYFEIKRSKVQNADTSS